MQFSMPIANSCILSDRSRPFYTIPLAAVRFPLGDTWGGNEASSSKGGTGTKTNQATRMTALRLGIVHEQGAEDDAHCFLVFFPLF